MLSVVFGETLTLRRRLPRKTNDATYQQRRSDGGVYRYIYPPKSVSVLFTCGTLTHVLKLQWLVKTYTPQIKFLATPLLTSDEYHQDTNLPRSGAAVCITLGVRTVDNTRWSQILVENRDFAYPPASRWNSAITFGIEKLDWCGYPMVKSFWGYVCSFWQNTRTWQTDRRTETQHSG